MAEIPLQRNPINTVGELPKTGATSSPAESQEPIIIPHPYFKKGRVMPEMVQVMVNHLLQIDMYATERSLHSMLEWLPRVLHPRNNKFQDGDYFGFSHVHYTYTEKEIDSDPVVRELMKKDERYIELITSGDALRILESEFMIKELSKKELNSRLIVKGVTALERMNGLIRLLGSTYFNILELSENDKDRPFFGDITNRAQNNPEDPGVQWEFFQFVRKYSHKHLPGFCALDSETLEKTFIDMVKRFDDQLEFAVYLTGDNFDTINVINEPQSIIGVIEKEGYIKARRDLDNLTDLKGITRQMLGWDEGKKEVGVYVNAFRENHYDRSLFLGISEMSLDKRFSGKLAYLLSEDSREALFPGKAVEDISNDDIKALFTSSPVQGRDVTPVC